MRLQLARLDPATITSPISLVRAVVDARTAAAWWDLEVLPRAARAAGDPVTGSTAARYLDAVTAPRSRP